MSVDGPDVRLSDDERQEALDALNEHVRTGRLDLDEYGERSARVTAARKRGELEPLFADLPKPKPSVLATEQVPNLPPEARFRAPVRRKLSEVAVPAAAVVAIVLFIVSKVWFVLLIPLVVALLAPSLFGRGR